MKYKIRTGDVVVSDAERHVIRDVLESTMWSEGKYTGLFEKEWADFIGTSHCSLVSNGTSGLMVGLLALDQFDAGKGVVVTSPLTYMATINAILLTGNQPVYVDIEEESLGMDPKKLEDYLRNNKGWVKAVMPVHLMGQACQIDKIAEICEKYGVALIEDNCESYGSRYNGRMLGSFGLFSVCSFFMTHTMQCSEMGSINTSNKDFFRYCLKIKSNGRTVDFDKKKEMYYLTKHDESDDFHPRYYHDVIGGNFRTQEFSAGLAYAQFQSIRGNIKRRNENVRYLNKKLECLSKVIKLPRYDKDFAYLGYVITINDLAVHPRKKIRQYLEDHGIETRPLFGCLPNEMPSIRHMGRYDLPVADNIGKSAFYVGCHQFINKRDLDYMIRTIKKAFEVKL